jgi:uncharacterized repeat protein (TIGR02543 family)
MTFVIVQSDDACADPDGLWINGHQVTGDTTNETEHWSYVASTNTLTLNGVAFTEHHLNTNTSIASPIYDDRDVTLKVVINGTNTITAGNAGQYTENNGIWTSKSLEISGDGSLSIDASYGNGILAVSSLKIDSGIISVTGSNCFDVFVPGMYPSIATFTMAGGTLNCTATGHIDVNGVVKISGGTITLNGTDGAVISVLDMGTGAAGEGTVTMTGGFVSAPSVTANQHVIFVDNVVQLNGAQITNMTPKKDIGAGDWVACDISEATGLFVTAAGAASIGSASPEKTVTFDANGGACATASSKTGADGKLTSLPDATRDGYDFDGWYTAADGGNRITTSTVFENDATVYAHWSEGGSGKGTNVPLVIGGVVGVVAIAGIAAFFFMRKS